MLHFSTKFSNCKALFSGICLLSQALARAFSAFRLIAYWPVLVSMTEAVFRVFFTSIFKHWLICTVLSLTFREISPIYFRSFLVESLFYPPFPLFQAQCSGSAAKTLSIFQNFLCIFFSTNCRAVLTNFTFSSPF